MKFLLNAALLLFLLGCAGFSQADSHCCMTDGSAFTHDSPQKIKARFDLYRRSGVDMLRVGMEWRALEGAKEGQWDDTPYRPYLDTVVQSGFAVKLIAGTIMGPPGWFLDQHPEARIINEDGRYSTNTISFWYPELHALLDKKLTLQFQYLAKIGLLKNVKAVVVDCGPAGEAIYPAVWTLGPGFDHETFWCYDANAQKDFREKMRQKYGTVTKANTAWNTNFENWDAVTVPKPGTHPGVFWADVLTWYRAAKRDFIVWQIGNFKKRIQRFLGTNAKPLMYIPGSDIRDQEWADAVKTGSGDGSVRLMADSRWLMTTAAKMGCVLQYTGVSNRGEVEYLRQYMDAHGLSKTPMWGENAGAFSEARHPLLLAEIIRENRLWGLDYTFSDFAFADDHVTPTPVFAQLKEAFAEIHQAVKSPATAYTPLATPDTPLDARFSTGLETGQPQAEAQNLGGDGLESSACQVTPGAGRGGGAALVLTGTPKPGSPHSFVYFGIFSVSLPVKPNTVLRYYLQPGTEDGRHTGIDLLFSDGTALRDLGLNAGLQDSYGRGVHPTYSKGRIGRWTQIEVPLGEGAVGKTITRIMFACDENFSSGPIKATVDDLVIGESQTAAAKEEPH